MSAPRKAEATRLYITGFMGSGKSTVGPLLARRLGYEFVDLDARIEERSGKLITELFRDSGEGEFRALERRELEALRMRERVVVATGGGALTDEGSFAIIRSSGVLVYLRVTLETLVRRLLGMRGRPKIASADGGPLEEGDLRARVSSLLASREGLYSRADIIVDCAGLTPEETVASILRTLEAHPPA